MTCAFEVGSGGFAGQVAGIFGCSEGYGSCCSFEARLASAVRLGFSPLPLEDFSSVKALAGTVYSLSVS